MKVRLAICIATLTTVTSFVPSVLLTGKQQSALAATREKEVMAATEYSTDALKSGLAALSEGSDDSDFNSRHIFGLKDDNHKLSMLQVITATRYLDYEAVVLDPESPSIESLLDDAATFAKKNGPIVNLQQIIQKQSPRMALAAEFKRASPSKGDIATHLDAGEQAAKYAAAGADIISVLTETRWFKGTLDDLENARVETQKAVESRPAILRKDFVVNEYMIAEAAARGADTILLIVAVLPQHVLERLINYSRSLGMEPLVEVHADEELDVALSAGAKTIGVNNRNLHTFQMDLTTSERVAGELQRRGLSFAHESKDPEYTVCALSGMSTSGDVDRFRQVGLGMCLIGESLMRAADPGQSIKDLCLSPEDYKDSSGVGGAYTQGTKVVKVCGVTNPEDALAACRAGANMIGVIFASKSKRKVDSVQAKAVVDAVQDFGERSASHTFDSPDDSDSPLQHLVKSGRELAEASRRPLVVGVFQNQDTDFIREMVETCGLDLVQLHGQEGFAAANRKNFGVPALRVVDIVVDGATGKAADNAVEVILESLTNDPIAILLDTAIKGQEEGGGTNVSFDWTIAERVQAEGLPVMIAGGLSPSSVTTAVTGTRPFGVDVASGTEASPGVKDHGKVRNFVQNAQKAAVEASKGF